MFVAKSTLPCLSAYCKEVVAHRQLLRFFIWRDIVVRYKQALLGVTWVVLKPVLTMLLFTFIFGFIARFPSDQVSYPLFVLAGMLPWQYLASCTVDSCTSLINNNQLITKAYFPRLVLPISCITAQGMDFVVNAAVLLLLIPLFGHAIPIGHLLYLPLIALWTYLLCLGLGIWLAALTVRYRDVKFLVTFFIQFGMFLSPVGYGTFLIPEAWLSLYALNPLVGLIDAYRWVFLDVSHPYIYWTVLSSLLETAALCLFGLLSFRKTEACLIDLL